ncbi:MAG: hypothetical protein NWE76_04595 [Candidatus Bathyarchaeota archaeon]|nr:hypothetical protein [Candidatus Bathyarchaeota archaeon]
MAIGRLLGMFAGQAQKTGLAHKAALYGAPALALATGSRAAMGLLKQFTHTPGRLAIGGAVGGISAYNRSDSENPNVRMKETLRGVGLGLMAGGVASAGIRKWGASGTRGFMYPLKGMNAILGSSGRGLLQSWANKGAPGQFTKVGHKTMSEVFPKATKSPFVMKGNSDFIREVGRSAYRNMDEAGQIGFKRGALFSGAAQSAWETTSSAAKVAGKTAGWILHNPLTAAGIGVGTVGAYGYMMGADKIESPGLTGTKADVDYNRQAAAATNLQMGMIAPTGMVGTTPQMKDRYMQAYQQSSAGMVQGLHRSRHG